MAGMARAMGATLTGASKFAWQKNKIFIYSFFYFAPRSTNCTAASTQCPYVIQGVLCQHHRAL